VQSPPRGNSLIFARYVDENYAAQVILAARLTRFYERLDWQQRLKEAEGRKPKLLRRREVAGTSPFVSKRPATLVRPPVEWSISRE